MSTPTPVRIQRSRRKGSRLTSPNGLVVVCVSRGTKWGNPFKSGIMREDDGVIFLRTKIGAVVAFKEWLEGGSDGRAIAKAAKEELRGKNLACWCGLNEICHADVLLELANAKESP